MKLERKNIRNKETKEHMLVLTYPVGAPQSLWDQALTAYIDAEYYLESEESSLDPLKGEQDERKIGRR